MKLNAQIKKYRTGMNLSQEELAEKVYVTRQTISNWENNRCYPDIHSILLLSTLFDVSLDQLIKGDMEIMEEEIKKSEIYKLKHYGKILAVLMAAIVLTGVPSVVFFGYYGMIVTVLLFAITMYFALKVERCKKENDIQTFKEILAFTKGRHLDGIQKNQEIGKRPYQKILLALGSGVAAGAVSLLLLWLLLPFISGMR